MFYSVLMVLCLGTPGNYECTVSARRKIESSLYSGSLDACESDADSSINEALMMSGRRGFAFAMCVDQKDYTSTIESTRIAILKEGHNYVFSAYKPK